MTDSYRIPDLSPQAVHCVEDVIRGSRFITHMAHTPDEAACKAFIERIRSQHATATHNCWAYQAGPAGSTAHIGASDDGEPKGTAGRPMLTVLLHCGVGELTAVVTRYFGGTLLGTGGLVRAYQGMVKLGLESLPVKERRPSVTVQLRMEHRWSAHALRTLERFGAQLMDKRFASDVMLLAQLDAEQREGLLAKLAEVSGGRIVVEELSG